MMQRRVAIWGLYVRRTVVSTPVHLCGWGDKPLSQVAWLYMHWMYKGTSAETYLKFSLQSFVKCKLTAYIKHPFQNFSSYDIKLWLKNTYLSYLIIFKFVFSGFSIFLSILHFKSLYFQRHVQAAGPPLETQNLPFVWDVGLGMR